MLAADPPQAPDQPDVPDGVRQLRPPHRLEIRHHAQEQFGYLTPDDARTLGIDLTQLRLMAARGTIEHVGHGMYRMREVPPTQLDAYREAVLWTGRRGALSHETAHDLYELWDVNLAAIHLTVPRGFRTRKQVPAAYRLHSANLTPADVRWHEGIPIVTAELAILGGIEQGLGWGLIDQAGKDARAQRTDHQADRDAPGQPAGRGSYASAHLAATQSPQMTAPPPARRRDCG